MATSVRALTSQRAARFPASDWLRYEPRPPMSGRQRVIDALELTGLHYEPPTPYLRPLPPPPACLPYHSPTIQSPHPTRTLLTFPLPTQAISRIW